MTLKSRRPRLGADVEAERAAAAAGGEEEENVSSFIYMAPLAVAGAVVLSPPLHTSFVMLRMK